MISGQCFSRPDVERRCLSCILSTFAEQVMDCLYLCQDPRPSCVQEEVGIKDGWMHFNYCCIMFCFFSSSSCFVFVFFFNRDFIAFPCCFVKHCKLPCV